MSAPREPLSWLTLERYALGELPESERVAIESTLAADTTSLACLARIEADTRTLPPLPERASMPARPWWSFVAWPATAAFVTVAALVLWLRTPHQGFVTVQSPSSAGLASVKGDTVALSLIRERDGSVAWDPTLFTSSDRFKVRVTCGSGRELFASVVVHQDGRAMFPLEAQAVSCGNNVVLDGAFRLSGSTPVEICVVVSESRITSRHQLELIGPATADADCLTVSPVP